jgi:hypothetical protein
MASFKNIRLSPAIYIAREPVQRQFQEEPSPFSVRPMAGLDHWEQGLSLSIGLKFTMVQAMQIWIFQLALVISIEWRILSINSSDEGEAEDHYNSDNSLSPEEREYRRQRDEQDAAHSTNRTPARRAEIRQNNCRHHQERRAARSANDILPIYERHDNNTPPDYDDETTSRRSTPIPLTGNETWGDLNDVTTITGLTVQQRADALELALVDSYRQHRSLPRMQSWDQWQELREHWYHINGYSYMDTLPRHILAPMYTPTLNAQLLTETVPAEYVCET